MVLLQPEEGVRDQEIFYLIAPVVEDQSPPVPVLPESRILVLVEGRAVEARQTVGILGKMSRHPVKDHADSGLMERIDEMTEFVGGSKAAAGGKEIHHLIAPGTIEGMLHHGQ